MHTTFIQENCRILGNHILICNYDYEGCGCEICTVSNLYTLQHVSWRYPLALEIRSQLKAARCSASEQIVQGLLARPSNFAICFSALQ